MNYQNILIVWLVIVVINLTGFKCSLWDFTSDVLPKGTMKEFRKLLRTVGHIVVFTGAGISTDSGIMSYRGSWGYWRKWNCRDLDSSGWFKSQAKVAIAWEFNNFRRDYILTKEPNDAHYAIVDLEKYLEEEGKGRRLSLITLNTDGLHTKAGSKNILEFYGTVWKTECTRCGNIENNTDNPICPALAHSSRTARLDGKDLQPPPNPRDLPHCSQPNCKSLLRLYMTLHDEIPRLDLYSDAADILIEAELVIMVGISFSNVCLAGLPMGLAIRRVPIAEFNIQKTCITSRSTFHFRGPASLTLPPALNLTDTSDLEKN